MANIEKWEQRLSENALTILVWIFAVAVFAIVIVGGFYIYYFSGLPIKADAAPWGQFGDFFGGTLNPIFGFLSVMALLAALVIQGRELKVSTLEQKKSAEALDKQNKSIAHQNFEQTFFSWLDNYRNMLNAVELHTSVSGPQTFRGRHVLRVWWSNRLSANSFSSRHPVLRNGALNTKPFNECLRDFEETSLGEIANLASNEWAELYRDNEYQLDSLFRNLYSLILWIDSQDENRISLAQKWFYVSVVRAQLSWIEMVYLFYNGQSSRGSKFRRLLQKYALFDNLNFDSDSVISHLKEHAPPSIRYAPTAFNSGLARQAIGLPETAEETFALAVV